MFTTLKNRKGLTLIELIAVLVILGIIAAIAVPTIGNTINNQKQRAAEAEWSAIQSAAELYAFQNSDDTAISMDDLFDNDYISENVALTEDEEGSTAIDSSDTLFTVSGSNISVDSGYTSIYIDGFQVYPES